MKPIIKDDIAKVWLTDKAIYIETKAGKIAQELFENFSRLRYATAEQRADYKLEHSGIRWENLDEDLSYDGFFHEKPEEDQFISTFKNLYGINISAIARRAGISQSLMAAYISGIKKPSLKRKKEIEAILHELGKELNEVQLT